MSTWARLRTAVAGLRRVCQGNGMRKYVIMGVPGAGKSTQAGALRLDLDLVHISVGDIFRWNGNG